jgi:hypothetical protein
MYLMFFSTSYLPGPGDMVDKLKLLASEEDLFISLLFLGKEYLGTEDFSSTSQL